MGTWGEVIETSIIQKRMVNCLRLSFLPSNSNGKLSLAKLKCDTENPPKTPRTTGQIFAQAMARQQVGRMLTNSVASNIITKFLICFIKLSHP